MGIKVNPELEAKILAMSVPSERPPEAPPEARKKGGRRSKYRNQKQEYDGLKFDSKLELRIWLELKRRQAAGEIHFLRRQVSYRIVVNGQLVCRYVADYVFIRNGRQVVADAKGVETPVFKLKAKLLRITGGIEIVCWQSVKAVVEWFREN